MPSTEWINVVVIGDRRSGKSVLAYHLLSGSGIEKRHSEYAPPGTIDMTIRSLKHNNQCTIKFRIKEPQWDQDSQCKQADAVLYCVDLSNDIDFEQMDREIAWLQSTHGRLLEQLYVIGTKADESIRIDADRRYQAMREHLDKKINTRQTSIIGAPKPITSKQGIDELSSEMITLAKHIATTRQDKQKKENDRSFIALRPEHRANRQFEQNIQTITINLPEPDFQQSKSFKKALDQIRNLFQPQDLKHIDTHLIPFTKTILQSQDNSEKLKAIKIIKQDLAPFLNTTPMKTAFDAFLAAAIILVILSAIGFGLGLAFGAWGCSAVFIAGFFTGNLGAVAVVSTSAITASLITGWSFYAESSDRKQHLNHLVDEATQEYTGSSFKV